MAAEHRSEHGFFGTPEDLFTLRLEHQESFQMVTTSSTGVARNKHCAECGAEKTLSCSKCGMIRACGRECFEKLWASHKRVCKRLQPFAKCRTAFIKHIQFFASIHASKSVIIDSSNGSCIIKFVRPVVYRPLYFNDQTWNPGTKLTSLTFDLFTCTITMKRGRHDGGTRNWRLDTKNTEARKSAEELMDRYGISECAGSCSTVTRARLDEFVCENQTCTIMVCAKLAKDCAQYTAGEVVACVVLKTTGWMRIVGNKGIVDLKVCERIPSLTIRGRDVGGQAAQDAIRKALNK